MSQAIHAAMAAIVADFPGISKDHKNPSQGYQYRGIDDGLCALNPLLAKHKVYLQLCDLVPTFSEGPTTKAGIKQVRCTVVGLVRFVSGEDGSYTEASLIGEGIDSGDKAMMKAQANGLKYVIWYSFAVPTAEKKDSEAYPDDDSEAPAAKRQRAARGRREPGQVVDVVNGTDPGQSTAKMNRTPAQSTESGQALLARIAELKSGAEYLDLHPEVKLWVQGGDKSSPERKQVIDAFLAAKARLSVA